MKSLASAQKWLGHFYHHLLAAFAATGTTVWLIALRDRPNDQLAVAWVVASFVGFYLTFWTLCDSLNERGALRRYNATPDPATVTIANGNVRREAFRTSVFVALFLLGVTALTNTSNPTTGRLMLILVNAFLITNSALDRIERHETEGQIRKAVAAALVVPTAADTDAQASP
jgi:hypothetical protein